MTATVLVASLLITANPGGLPDMDEFVVKSVLVGLTHDGASCVLIGRLASRNDDYVPKCLLCKWTREAFTQYSKLREQPKGRGLDADVARRLDSDNPMIRRDAMRSLVQGYIERGYKAFNFSVDQRKSMQTDLEKQRNFSMGVKAADVAFCPSCDGVCCMTPRNEELAWGKSVEGVESRLSLVTEKPTLGQPIHVKLELRNSGTTPASYDSQQAAVNGSLEIRGPGGEKVSYSGAPVQTFGGNKTLNAGETITIFANLDVNAQYHLARAGKYSIQFHGRNGLPTSNVLTVTLADAPLSDYQKLFGALRKVTPAGWEIIDYGESIGFISSPTGLKSDVASITLFFLKEPSGGPKPQRGQPAPIKLGDTTLGKAWLMADSPKAIERWGDYEKVISEPVRALKKQW